MLLEQTIISNLLYNDDFSRKVTPYIKNEYFEDPSARVLFDSFSNYMSEYKEPPSIEALRVLLDLRKDLNEDSFKDVLKVVAELKIDKATNQEWLLSETEKFCQNADLHNSIRKAIIILDGKDKEMDKGSIPKLISDSLGISFDTHIGHDYLADAEERYDFYHRKEERIPFDVDILNKITKGGLPRKSLTILLATTGGGKSLVKCHMAATSFMHGKNVLYISSEMPEERIAERIDANLLNVTLDQLMDMPRDVFQKKIKRIRDKQPGQLIFKEYPTGTGHAGNFRHLLNDLRLKKNFIPDIIFVDYLNICASSRIKGAAAANSYTLVKSIAEEIRGLAMEFNCPIVSSSQFNRGAYDSSDVDLTNTSESMGIAHTADCILGLISSEELESLGQIMIKQLKNRWGDLGFYRRFVVGINRSKMRIFDLEENVQTGVNNETSSVFKDKVQKDKPAFDNTKFGEENFTRLKDNKNSMKKMEGFK
jgi:replicative DNA helicase